MPLTSPRPAAALRSALTLITVTLSALAVGCHRTVPDATITSTVQSALAADSAISQQPVQVATQAGVVTLTGNVADDTASTVAARDAAQVNGVKEVVNDLTVAGLTVNPTITSPAAPTVPRPATHQEVLALQNHQTLPPPPENAPAPPPPVYHDVTVPAGTDIPIRVTQALDSATTQSGTPFSGVTLHPIVIDGYIAVPAGAAVHGTVVDAKDATHFKGSSLLSLQLDSIRRHGESIPVNTAPYTVEGHGRGANTAEKIGGGAAIGAVLGGIFGGGKGAAIGAGVGGGGGAAVQGFTRGQQVAIPSESVVRFRLKSSITVHTAEQAGEDDAHPGLQSRP